MSHIFTKYKYTLILSLFYFVIRLVHLTLLPIFTDEGIYLDWGWREVTIPGNLFYSLFDAKQPFVMWLFGVSMDVFSDALFAGRFVSVCMGYLTLIGLYKLGNEFFAKKVWIFASLLYICIPLFSFYDRQALMESAVSATGVWSLYYMVQILKNPIVRKYQLFLGGVLGIGLLIKTSTMLFLFASLSLLLIHILRKEISIKHAYSIAGIVGGTIIATSFILLIQPQFWSTLNTNSRYALTIPELIQLPIINIFSNLIINSQIIFIMLTPLVTFIGIYGLYKIVKKKEYVYLVVWFILLVFLQSFLVRDSSVRYLVSYLPVYTIFAAYGIYELTRHSRKIFLLASIALISIPLLITSLQIYSPLSYFTKLSSVTPHSERGGYVTSANAGYGVLEVKQFLESQAIDKKIYVTTALNTGNPESALRAYLAKNNNISIMYFDAQMFDKSILEYDCFKSDRQFFFISRDEQQASFNKFFSYVKKIQNPYGNNSIGIYTLNTSCKGKTLPLDLESIKAVEDQ